MKRIWTALRRRRDVWLCALLTAAVGVFVLWRLALLSPSTWQDSLVVDSARTALVAKNIVEGNGYTTNDLPASLVAFYHQEGKLHDAAWVNADRFPFAAYATAALYLVTGQRDAWTGVIVYNLLTFVLFLTALYMFVARVTKSRAGGAIAVVLALLHGHTYFFLFMKDADMMLLAVLAFDGFERFFATPMQERSPWRMAWFGTVLGWSFLSRPNVGAPLLVALAVASLIGLVRELRRDHPGVVFKQWARADLVAGAVAAAWLVPLLIHTVSEWGSPFFSANSLYQGILGTRFGMNTDTWWRYVPPAMDLSLGNVWSAAHGDMLAKLTTSWLATLKTFVAAYFVELALAFVAVHVVRARKTDRVDGEAREPVRDGVRWMVLVAVVTFVFNYATLPLFSYKAYSWRHYLAFILPIVWMGAAISLLHIGAWLEPAWTRARAWARDHKQLVVAAIALFVVVLAFRARGIDGNFLVMGVTRFWERRWLLASFILLALLLGWWKGRWGAPLKLVMVTVAVTAVFYRPHRAFKNFTHIHVPASNRVWKELDKRDGLVTSFALQTQVSWNTGRKNIPAPEWVMRIYEMTRVHDLWFEDIYIESPEAQLSPRDGLFGAAAPGFEGYLRLATYRAHVPGYALAFHEDARVGRSRFGIPKRAKSSTVYTLADRAAVTQLFATPTEIAIGDPKAVVHTAHGFGGYYTIDGKSTVLANDVTRERYQYVDDRPWEDTSVTLFVDERVPAQVTIELYAPAANSLTFYWNLDLDEYTPKAKRKQHELGSFTIPAPGWHTVTLAIPRNLVRTGLNKLGFRAGYFPIVGICAAGTSDAACRSQPAVTPPSLVVLAPTSEADAVWGVSAFLHRIAFTF